MEKNYTINKVAVMTGLSTRTIRNYLKSGLVNGEKINGIWTVSANDFCDMLGNPAIKPSIKAKHNSVVYDFLADERKKTNKICAVIDLYEDDAEAEEISGFFCSAVNNEVINDIIFKFEKNGRYVRVILSGSEENVIELLNRYYNE